MSTSVTLCGYYSVFSAYTESKGANSPLPLDHDDYARTLAAIVMIPSIWYKGVKNKLDKFDKG